MEPLIYLDTHVVVWLYTNQVKKFPQETLQLIENSQSLVSPMVLLELEYMHEIGRLQPSGNAVLETLSQSIGLKVCELSHLQVISAALQQTWTRDPFDRVIVGQAAVNQSTLVTKDVLIGSHYPRAFWSLETKPNLTT
jgi:PIN domain nuclease of toxin-antitoxin system